MNSIIFKKSVLLYSMMALVLLVSSCTSDQEEYTGAGNVVPTSPQITITPEVSNLSLVEDDSSYSYTVALSTVQLVDVVVKISQVDGDATMGEDFTIDNSLVISAGSTSATGTITILSDELAEETETVTIQVGDNTTANASITPETMTFTILNLSEGDLVIDLEWMQSSSVTDNFGNEADPLDVADLRLLITNIPYTQILDESDGTEFENYVLTADKPDGEYYVVADFYASNGIPTNLDLHLNYNQLGEINDDSYDYTQGLFNCPATSSNYYIMSKITKAGTNYTIEYVGEAAPFSVNGLVGTYSELSEDNPNNFNTTNEITLGVGENELMISGIYDRLWNVFWGETFQPGFGNEGFVSMILSPDNSIDIPSQYMGQTEPGPWDYWMKGSGTYDPCTLSITLSYDLYFDDTTSGSWQPSTIVIQLD